MAKNIKTEENKNPDIPDKLTIIKKITEILESRKCEHITALNLENVNSFLSYFIIATAKTSLQAKSASREISRQMKSYKLKVFSKQDDAESGWILLDFNDILVHIMTPEIRDFYNLEKLWGDAKNIQL